MPVLLTILIGVVFLSSCGEGTQVAPFTNCFVTKERLDFGDVCLGESKIDSFAVGAWSNNTQSISGTVSFKGKYFEIMSGEGSYNLGAKARRVVKVKFTPEAVGSFQDTIQTGCALVDDVIITGIGRAECAVYNLTPVDGSFPAVCVGETVSKDFIITAPLANKYAVSGNITETCDDFAISAGADFDLQPGGSKTLTVSFTPLTAGSKTCMIVIDSADEGPKNIEFNGFARADCGVYTVDPADGVFSSVCVGGTLCKDFIISSPAGNEFAVSGSVTMDCDNFSISVGDGDFDLQPGESKTVTVCFSPTATGSDGCTMNIASADDGPEKVQLNGFGVAGTCIVPQNVDFGSVCVRTSMEKSFEILCPTSSPCAISGNVTEDCPEYEIFEGGGAFDLNPGQSRTVKVRFSPTSTGSKPCTIVTGTDCSINLSGMAVIGSYTVSQTPDFGDVCVKTNLEKSFDITCPASSPCKVLGTLNEDCDEFEIIDGKDFNLEPGGSHKVTVRFSPTSTGSKICPIVISSPDEGPDDVTVVGNGIQATCTVSTTGLNFADFCFGLSSVTSQTFTIMNPGITPCVLEGTVSLNCADFWIVRGGEPYSLAPGESHVVEVAFDPQSVGPKTCTIETGALCDNVTAEGLAQEFAYLDIQPLAGDFDQKTNVPDWFTSKPTMDTNLLAFNQPDWSDCGTSGWEVSQTPLDRGWFELVDLDVPPGTTHLRVEFRSDVQLDCVKLVLQIDRSDEVILEDLSQGCTTRELMIPITAGTHDILLGLASSVPCILSGGAATLFDCVDGGCPQTGKWIRYTFVGACTPNE
jgi:uncharacterized cupredoxin-like copper-binding protein